MVVVITSTGGVTKKIFPFERAVDPQLAEWARAFLNEQLTGVRLGGRMLQRRLDEPGLSPREAEFLAMLRPAFSELVGAGEQGLYVGGAARLLDEMRFADLAEINDLVRVLEEPRRMLAVLRGALDRRGPTCASAPTTPCPTCAAWPWWPPTTGWPRATSAPFR